MDASFLSRVNQFQRLARSATRTKLGMLAATVALTGGSWTIGYTGIAQNEGYIRLQVQGEYSEVRARSNAFNRFWFLLVASSLLAAVPFAYRRFAEASDWVEDDRAIQRWGRGQLQERLLLPPSQQEIQEFSLLLPEASFIPPVEDLALKLAQARNGSTLIACETGTGKTSFLRAAMVHAAELTQHQAKFWVIDGKGDADGFCGVEQTDRFFLSGLNTISEIACKVNEFVEGNADAIEFMILDEWNNTLGDAATYDSTVAKSQKANPTKPVVKRGAYQIVTKGRSRKKLGWITSHSPNVEDMEMNSAIQQSVNLIALGRGNKFAAILSALQGRRPVIDDPDLRKELYEKYLSYRRSPQFNREQPLALTNLEGEWRLVLLPDYRSAVNVRLVPEVLPSVEVEPQRLIDEKAIIAYWNQLQAQAEPVEDDRVAADRSLYLAYRAAREAGKPISTFYQEHFGESMGGGIYPAKAQIRQAVEAHLMEWWQELEGNVDSKIQLVWGLKQNNKSKVWRDLEGSFDWKYFRDLVKQQEAG